MLVYFYLMCRIPNIYLNSWCKKFVETPRFELFAICGKYAFPQNFHTRDSSKGSCHAVAFCQWSVAYGIQSFTRDLRLTLVFM